LIDGIGGGALEEYTKFLPNGSVVIRLKPEMDDIIGKRIQEEIFENNDELELEGDVEQDFEKLKHRVLELAEGDIIGFCST